MKRNCVLIGRGRHYLITREILWLLNEESGMDIALDSGIKVDIVDAEDCSSEMQEMIHRDGIQT